MAALIEKQSTITAKGQTTVPKTVRQALGLRSGDRLTYRIARNGTVSLTRDDRGEAAVDSFLAFLADDIKRRPEALELMSDETARRLRELTAGVEVDLDEDLPDAPPL